MNQVLQKISIYYLIFITTILITNVQSRQHHQHSRKYSPYADSECDDLSLWIDEQQVKRFSGKFRLLFTK